MTPAQYPTTADTASANTLGATASPLLAGFSMTLIGLIAGNASPGTVLRFPDITLIVLFCATVFFILAVQFTIVARKFNLTKAEYEQRTPNMDTAKRDSAYGLAMEAFCLWIDRAHLVFIFGLGLLFLGLAGVMLPPNPSCLRLVTVSLPIFVSFGEMVWYIKDYRQSHKFQKSLEPRDE